MNKNIKCILSLLLLISLVVNITSVPNQRFRQAIRRPFTRNDQLRKPPQQQRQIMPNFIPQQQQREINRQLVVTQPPILSADCKCNTEMKHLTDFLIPATLVASHEATISTVPTTMLTSTTTTATSVQPTSTFKLFGLDMVV